MNELSLIKIKTKVYLCIVRNKYYVLRAECIEQASKYASEIGGYVIREAYNNEWYEHECELNYCGDLK